LFNFEKTAEYPIKWTVLMYSIYSITEVYVTVSSFSNDRLSYSCLNLKYKVYVY